MNRIELVSRRTFIGGMFSAGALVLGARLLPVTASAGTSCSRCRVESERLFGIGARRHSNHSSASLGDGDRHSERAADCGG